MINTTVGAVDGWYVSPAQVIGRLCLRLDWAYRRVCVIDVCLVASIHRLVRHRRLLLLWYDDDDDDDVEKEGRGGGGG